jgi:hypothetical protein
VEGRFSNSTLNLFCRWSRRDLSAKPGDRHTYCRHTESNPILVNVGDRQVIGSGDDINFEYLPVFWVHDTTEPGDYHAEFQLVDVNTPKAARRCHPPAASSSSSACPKPVLAVAPTITVTLSLVTDGWELIAAPEASGPWEVIPWPPAPDTTYKQTGTTYPGTFPLTAESQFYQLRRMEAPASN